MAFNQKMFGQRIQEARMSCGITQEKFAEEIDISLSYYHALERRSPAYSCNFGHLCYKNTI